MMHGEKRNFCPNKLSASYTIIHKPAFCVIYFFCRRYENRNGRFGNCCLGRECVDGLARSFRSFPIDVYVQFVSEIGWGICMYACGVRPSTLQQTNSEQRQNRQCALCNCAIPPRMTSRQNRKKEIKNHHCHLLYNKHDAQSQQKQSCPLPGNVED